MNWAERKNNKLFFVCFWSKLVQIKLDPTIYSMKIKYEFDGPQLENTTGTAIKKRTFFSSSLVGKATKKIVADKSVNRGWRGGTTK